MMKTLDQRLHYIDHLRGFMFLLMAVDHALHAYALNWGRFWFFQDEVRTPVFDALYLHNQSIIMPMLFFIFGMFVLPSVQNRGYVGYWKERLFRFVPIYLVGVFFIVPILSYPRYEYTYDPGINYLVYWWDVFLGPRFQAGPLWVVHALLGYSLFLFLFYWMFSKAYHRGVRLFKWCFENPIPGAIVFGLKSFVLLAISDIIWGAPWWIKIGPFALQASKMFLVLLYFFAGSCLVQAGILQNKEKMESFSKNWPVFLAIYVVLAGLYMYGVTQYHQMAFSEDIRLTAAANGGWISGWQYWTAALPKHAPAIFMRTFVHAFMCLFQALTLVAIFYRFVSRPNAFWTSLAKNCFAIFLTHEAIVIWLQYYLVEVDINLYFKFIICAAIGISLSWLISDKLILKVYILRRLINPDAGK